MCGIAGFFEAPSFGPDTLRRMLQTMQHRGPDADGIWVDPQGRCSLGHQRLSIIDTSAAGRQPMSGSNHRWVISFNGEIYNFLELRPLLEAQGARFHGRTDTEVLIEALAHWGTGALERLDGMFAFAAFDTLSGELLLARDPFGEKPLYYCRLADGGIAFASELQALEVLPSFDAEASLEAISELLLFQYVGAPRTIYRGVSKLAPGHWLRMRPGSALEIGRYFAFDAGAALDDPRPLAAVADEVEDILVRSLRRRMISDVPLGAFLSGGVDSSTVCALVRRKLKLPLSTFSIGFRGALDSEHEIARRFAEHLGTRHHEQILDPSVGDFLLNIGAMLDEPNADSSCLPTYLLSQFARQHVTVAISGDGGDELFCGYQRYLITLAEACSPALRWNAGKAYYSGRLLISTEEQVGSLVGEVPAGTRLLLERLRHEVASGAAPLHARMRNTDVANYLPGAVLPKVDRMSMRHSLEVRTPFLNVELARFAARLPTEHLYQPNRGKVVLREIARRYLPPSLVETPKRGFGLPMARWAQQELMRIADILLLGPESRLRSAFGDAALDGFLATQRSRTGYDAYRLWAVAMLESWCRHHPVKLPKTAPAQKLFSAATRWQLKDGLHALRERIVLLFPRRLLFLARLFAERLRSQRRAHGNLGALLWANKRVAFHVIRLVSSPPRIALRNAAQAELLRLIKSHVGTLNAAFMETPLRAGDRVVLVAHDLGPGGAQRQWCYLARGLKDRGYDVSFLLIEEPVGENGHYLEYLRQLGIEPLQLRDAAPSGEPDARLSALCASAGISSDLGRMAARLRVLRPAVVFSALDTPNIVTGIGGVFAAVPHVVLSFRNYNPSRFSYMNHAWYKPMYRVLCQARNIVLSGNAPEANADYAGWLGIDARSIAFVPNAISPELFRLPPATEVELVRRQLSIRQGQPVVLGVFRLSEEKQPLLFIDVCARILRSRPDARIIHAGVGHEEPSIRRAVAARGLQGRITFLGARQDVPALMAMASLLLLTSTLEGMPNVVIEAQFSGIPVVATIAGATPECVVDRETGFLLNREDAEGLAAACLRILGDASLARQMGHAAADWARSEFAPQRMVDRYIDLINRPYADAALYRENAA
jgi:asparagine synthase (glutamine-hydrolysing)